MLDIEGNTTNLFHELPRDLNKNDKQLLLETQEIYKQHKEICVMLTKQTCYCIPEHFKI